MGRILQIPTARAYEPFLKPSRYKGAVGGRGSGKSNELATLLIERCLMKKGTRWACIREVQKSLEQSVKRLLEDKIKKFQLEADGFIIKHTTIETPGDGVLIFQGMQDHTADSIKSLEGFDGAWVEEAQTLSDRSLKLLRPTIREDDSEIWMSWNPDKETDPVDVLLRGPNKLPASEATVIHTTFRDNPWFPDVLKREMEYDRNNDPESYQHVWEGAYEKKSSARVFKNWRVEEFDSPDNTHYFLGADWGFSVDPSTLVRSRVESHNALTGQEWPRKRLYIDHELFDVGVEIDYMPLFFDGLICGCPLTIPGQAAPPCLKPQQHGWARHMAIVADSSRPDTISYLRRHGYGYMEPAKKGQNSVKDGVIFLQSYDIIIHPRCKRTIDEFSNYCYVVDQQSGLVTSVLQDKKNHIIDPVRYALEQLRGAMRQRATQWG